MAIEPFLLATLTSHIHVGRRSVSENIYGDAFFEEPVRLAARIDDASSLSDLTDEQRRIGNVLIVVDGEVGDTDRVWLPQDDQADEKLARMPKSVVVARDIDGNVSHHEVLL